MSFWEKIFGRPLASGQRKKQELTILTGVAALGLDAFASTAYGPEAALMILLPLGAAEAHYFSFITLAIIAMLITLYLSYQQTTAAYPMGGGAYIVASDNLGRKAGLWAAIALLLDYLLNVAVGISAGIGALVSAIPALQPYTLILCLAVLFMLTILNLRGIRESGLFFVGPIIAFVLCLSVTFIIGLVYAFLSDGNPKPVVSIPAFPSATESIGIWLLLGAFANGLTAMTGIEAVSNAVPLFSKPTVKNAQWTLTVIVGVLVLFLLCLGYLCPAYHIVAMDESKPGYQTILTQLVAAVTGKGVFYYISAVSIFIILTYSAQTSFAGFPRVCRLLAQDNFLPHFFAEHGRRLVFTHGILVLAFFSALLLIAFKGITLKLIPLFAVGAFSAFLFSQIGMVVHWLRKKDDQKAKIKLFFNGLGAVTTGIALIIIIAEKFIDGAWIIVIVAPLLALLFSKIQKHYAKLSQEISGNHELQISKLYPPIVIIPIRGWNALAEKAVRFALLISEDVTAVFINEGTDEDGENLKKIWKERVAKPAKVESLNVPHLKIIKSPYRLIYKPILSYVKKIRKEKPDHLIAVIIPKLIEPHWYEYLLHNVHAEGLRALLFLEGDEKTVVITIPWYLRD